MRRIAPAPSEARALQVFRTQACVPGQLRQGDRPQFLFVMVGETNLGPALAAQRAMGTRGANDTPPDPAQRGKHSPCLCRGPSAHAAMENCSVSAAGFISPCSISSAITRSARDLAFSAGSGAVHGHPRQFGNVANPAAVRLAKQPDGELHMLYPTKVRTGNSDRVGAGPADPGVRWGFGGQS